MCECYHPRPGELSHVIQLATTIYTGGPFGVAGTRNQSFERIRRLTCNSSVSRFLFEDFFIYLLLEQEQHSSQNAR